MTPQEAWTAVPGSGNMRKISYNSLTRAGAVLCQVHKVAWTEARTEQRPGGEAVLYLVFGCGCRETAVCTWPGNKKGKA